MESFFLREIDLHDRARGGGTGIDGEGDDGPLLFDCCLNVRLGLASPDRRDDVLAGDSNHHALRKLGHGLGGGETADRARGDNFVRSSGLDLNSSPHPILEILPVVPGNDFAVC